MATAPEMFEMIVLLLGVEQAGIQLRFFENLDHEQEVTERKILLEPVLTFLRG
ncbi:hypothetical protein KDW_39970 [Dictyobacter vulcani]|uniref:Uncharacterized protein n=1 Tax=Dictyobacter vulcani TaxID=2607529 RepID=A0A5J4KPN3_9CHLR|nr:hypothetical protein [Dictyobacter vulcani]GER89835.1 hypothetical protein KDW_39970 [Dictyobacter vulcani]